MYIQISHAGHIYISLQIVLLNCLNNQKLNRIWTGTLLFPWHLMKGLLHRTWHRIEMQQEEKGVVSNLGGVEPFFTTTCTFFIAINNFLQMFELKELFCIKFCLGTLQIVYPHFIKLPLTNIYNIFQNMLSTVFDFELGLGTDKNLYRV